VSRGVSTLISTQHHKALRAFTFEVVVITAYMLWAFLEKRPTTSTIANYMFGIAFLVVLYSRPVAIGYQYPVQTEESQLRA
jgi:hypothetical protein